MRAVYRSSASEFGSQGSISLIGEHFRTDSECMVTLYAHNHLQCMTRLFERGQTDQSISVALNQTLDAFHGTSQQLFLTAADPAGTAVASQLASPLPAELLDSLFRIDEVIGVLVERLKEHAETQARIDELLCRIRVFDSDWREDVREATRWKDILHATIEEGVRDRERICGSQKAKLEPEAVMAYSRRIANFTSAPPQAKSRKVDGQGIDWNALSRNHGAQMPWPDAIKLRSGRLATQMLAKQGLPVGETIGVETALATEEQHRLPAMHMPPLRMPLRVEAEDEEDEEDDFDIDLL